MKKIAASLTVLIASWMPSHANAATEAVGVFERAVTVSGSCLRSVPPDRGSVTITADVLAPDMAEASRKAMGDYERIRKEVQKLGLKDLELTTAESTFNEEKEWQKDRQVSKGFRARMGLRVATSDVTRLGEVIQLATKQGVKQVSGLSMFLSSEKMKVERESCLAEAVKNARSKAESIAHAANAHLGHVLTVTELGAGEPPTPRPVFRMKMAAAAAMDAEAAPPTIDTAPDRLSVEVHASFALE